MPDDDGNPPVLVLAPSGRDAAAACTLLQRHGCRPLAVASLAELAERVDDGAGAALVTSEALVRADLAPLVDALERAPAWSDLPFICLAAAHAGPLPRGEAAHRLLAECIANVLVLERPLSGESLVSAVRAALSARARQFRVRDQMQQLAQRALSLDQSRLALSDSEARFRAITDSVDQMIWSCPAGGEPDYYNERWRDYTGSDARWLDCCHPDDRTPAATRWHACVAAGTAWRAELRLRHCSGRWRWVLARAQPWRNAAGAAQRWFGSFTDIQEIVDAREVLARSREQLEQEVRARTRERDTIWRASADLLGVATHAGVWRSINPAWGRLLGWRDDEIVGRNSEWLLHPDDAARAPTAAPRSDSRLRTRGGDWLTIAWTAVPVDEELYCIGRDVTEQRRQAEALRQAQKMEAIGQLSGGIAHDFNNMLQGITGSLAVVQKRLRAGRTEDLARFVDNALKAAFRAAGLTHRLLAFARRQPLAPDAHDLNALLAAMQDLLLRSLGENVELEFVPGADLGAAHCDANQFENAILSLALNARDAMPGGGRVTIASSRVARAELEDPALRHAHYLCIAVRDTGRGMAPEVAARAFDPFFTTKPLGQGTGLGLSMTYGFARQSEGACRIDSTPGRGTTVRLYLPEHEGAAAPAAAPPAAAAAPARDAVAVVVEDDEVVRQLVCEALVERGFVVLQAIDGQAGLDLLAPPRRVDLLVTDIGLPRLDGRRLAETARLARPGLKVLFMTGYADAATGAAGFLQSGMAMVTKPFAIEDLLARAVELVHP